jgi:hypothetical protein
VYPEQQRLTCIRSWSDRPGGGGKGAEALPVDLRVDTALARPSNGVLMPGLSELRAVPRTPVGVDVPCPAAEGPRASALHGGRSRTEDEEVKQDDVLLPGVTSAV